MFLKTGLLLWQNLIVWGHSINKLQDGIILLIFKIRKIQNIGFVHNLILSSSYEFYHDAITVTLFVSDKYGDATAESIP